jgi:hypothetical protein
MAEASGDALYSLIQAHPSHFGTLYAHKLDNFINKLTCSSTQLRENLSCVIGVILPLGGVELVARIINTLISGIKSGLTLGINNYL